MFNPYSLYDIGKLSGNDSGDFPETFSKKFFCCIVTSLRTIIERDHVASTGGGLVHLNMISRQTSYGRDVEMAQKVIDGDNVTC